MNEEGVSLEKISVKDVLFFPDKRIEEVIRILAEKGIIYTERGTINQSSEKNMNMFPEVKEKVVYRDIQEINSTSVGKVYARDLINKDEVIKELSRELKKFQIMEASYE
jgi:hypothetical protein